MPTTPRPAAEARDEGATLRGASGFEIVGKYGKSRQSVFPDSRETSPRGTDILTPLRE